LHPRVRLEGRLLPAVELVQWRSDRNGVRPVAKVAAELVLRIHLLPRLTLDVGAGPDVVFNRFDFVRCADSATDCRGSARQVALSPWRVRPRARVGLSVGF
jgi:hypothetical protein